MIVIANVRRRAGIQVGRLHGPRSTGDGSLRNLSFISAKAVGENVHVHGGIRTNSRCILAISPLIRRDRATFEFNSIRCIQCTSARGKKLILWIHAST